MAEAADALPLGSSTPSASPLADSSFRRLWLAGAVSRFGSQVGRIGLVLFLVQVSGRVGDLALLIVLETLPGVLVAPFAGSLVDRLDRKWVMIQADVARALLVVFVLLWPRPAMIYAVACLSSVAGAFFQPAQRAILPGLVGEPALPRANGLVQSADHASFVLGPIAGAALMSAWGLGPTLVVDGLTFAVSAFLLLGVRRSAASSEPSVDGDRPAVGSGTGGQADTWRAIREGFAYILRHPLLMQLTVLFFVSLAATGLWLPLAPFFLRDVLGASEAALGWQLGAFGLGAVLGGALAPRVVAARGAGRTLSLALVLEGACMLLYSQLADLLLSTGLMVLWGVVVSLIVVPFYSIVQTAVEERFLGRVFALVQQSESAALLLAMGAAALLAEHVSSTLIFAGGGATYLLLAAVSTRTPGGRRLLAVP